MVSVDINVDIYTVRLEADATRLDSLYETLAPEECSRADRFHFAEHRLRFIVCRGTLREVLSPYLEMSPERIAFAYNDHGKPCLPDSDVRFNVSHSGPWALQAVTRTSQVGVDDIERIDPRFACDQIPERYFSPREVAQLRALPASGQTDAFFRCWTRKEAYIKARGLGMALPLDSFDVSLGPDDPPRLLRAGDWSVQDVDAPQGYAAAVVAEGPVFRTLRYPLPQTQERIPAVKATG